MVRLLHRLASVVRWMVNRDKAERELHDELEAFVEIPVMARVARRSEHRSQSGLMKVPAAP